MARHKLYPESVRPGMPKMPRLPPGWRAVPFGELLSPVYRPAELDDEVTYQLVTAKRSRGGIVPREELTGAEVKTKTQFYVQGGDFLISRRQIIHGACGFVPEALSGAVVSGEYDVLAVGPALLPEYLEAFTHTTYFQQSCFQSSVGVDIEKMVFDLDHWFTYPMPLPPLEEQVRIAGVLGRIKTALRANERALDQARRVKKALLSRLLSEGIGHTRFKETEIGRVPASWRTQQLGELMMEIQAGWSPECFDAPPPSGMWGVLKVSAITQGCFDPLESKALPLGLAPRPELEVRVGDVLCVRANGNPDLVGTTVLVNATPPKLMLSDKTLRLKPKQEVLDAGFLALAMQSVGLVTQLRERLAGSSGQKNISQATIRGLSVPTPSLREQKMIASAVQHLQANIEALERSGGTLQRVHRGSLDKLLAGPA